MRVHISRAVVADADTSLKPALGCARTRRRTRRGEENARGPNGVLGGNIRLSADKPRTTHRVGRGSHRVLLLFRLAGDQRRLLRGRLRDRRGRDVVRGRHIAARAAWTTPLPVTPHCSPAATTSREPREEFTRWNKINREGQGGRRFRSLLSRAVRPARASEPTRIRSVRAMPTSRRVRLRERCAASCARLAICRLPQPLLRLPLARWCFKK